MTVTTATDRYDWFLRARDVSAPIVMIGTPDQPETVVTLCAMLEKKDPVLQWDCLNGVSGIGQAGTTLAASLFAEKRESRALPALLLKAHQISSRTVIFVLNSHLFLKDPAILQGIQNCRDTFKQDGRMFCLLSPSVNVPPELVGSVLDFQEPLPTDEEIGELADVIIESTNETNTGCQITVDAKTREKVIVAARGLPAFQAETILAMSIDEQGYNEPSLWDRKIRELGRIPGVDLKRGSFTFDDVGGLDQMKQLGVDLDNGVEPPDLIVFFDEIEKSTAGSGSGGDTSGVSQDQQGQLLTWSSTNDVEGVLLFGLQGGGKTFYAECLGATYNIPTLIVDLGGCKDKLMGASEQNFRRVLEIIDSMAKRPLLIATCNDDTALSPEFMDRFTLGTYFFDEPTPVERESIWTAQLRRYPSVDPKQERPNDDHWTGRDIGKCVRLAHKFSKTLLEVAVNIVPLCLADPTNLETMRRKAHNRFLAASYPGPYVHPEERTEAVGADSGQPKRRILNRKKETN